MENQNVISIGQQAPDFETDTYENGEFKKFKLSNNNGKWTVLFFYPLDFTFICPTEIRAFAKYESRFNELGAQVIGASTDSVHSHKAWFQRDLPEVKFPIIADTTHKVSRIFGVLKEDEGIAYRGTFILDPEGVLRYSVISDLDVGRSVEETIRALEALKNGGLCPVEWKPGETTL